MLSDSFDRRSRHSHHSKSRLNDDLPIDGIVAPRRNGSPGHSLLRDDGAKHGDRRTFKRLGFEQTSGKKLHSSMKKHKRHGHGHGHGYSHSYIHGNHHKTRKHGSPMRESRNSRHSRSSHKKQVAIDEYVPHMQEYSEIKEPTFNQHGKPVVYGQKWDR